MKRYTEQEEDQFEDVRKLIALKRYETPGDEWLEDFMSEFHNRQRAEMLKCNAFALFMERLRTWIAGLEAQRWTWAAAGATCAAVVLGAIYIASPGTAGELALQAQVEIEQPAQNSLLREF